MISPEEANELLKVIIEYNKEARNNREDNIDPNDNREGLDEELQRRITKKLDELTD